MTKRKGKKRRITVSAVVVFLVVIVLLVQGAMKQPEIIRNKERIDDLKGQVQSHQEKLDDLEKLSEKVDTDEYIEKVGLWGSLRHVFLPSLAIGLSGMAGYARHTRSQMLDVLGSDYIRTARAKGLADRNVYYRHALRNVLSYMITMVSGTITVNLGGATVLEKVFNIQGVGLLSYSSLTDQDYPQEQAILIFFAAIFVFTNIFLDIIYKVLDPRIELD